MTTAELDVYVTSTLPTLRQQVLKTEIDNDILQEVLLWLTEHVEGVRCQDNKAFLSLVRSHFYHRKQYFNMTLRRGFAYGDRIGDGLLKKGGSMVLTDEVNAEGHEYRPRVVDPWHSTRIDALEYLELVQGVRLKRIMYNYYIEGFDMVEIGRQEGITKQTVILLIQRGVRQIKKALSNLK